MKKLSALALCALLATGTAYAEDESPFSANVGFTSDYVFRGVSQTLEEPAVQGGFDYAHASGFYAGVWGSNVNFGDGDEAHLEFDVYAGYSAEVGKLGYDLGLVYYAYPGASSSLDYDFLEAYGSLSYDFGSFSLSGGLNVSPDFFGSTGTATYVFIGASVPLGDTFTVSADLGRQDIEDADDYIHWRLGVAASAAGFDFDLSYHDTDWDNGGDLADSRLVLSVSRSF